MFLKNINKTRNYLVFAYNECQKFVSFLKAIISDKNQDRTKGFKIKVASFQAISGKQQEHFISYGFDITPSLIMI